MPIHRIAVAADSLRDLDGLRTAFGERAEIVVGPVGTPAEVAALTEGAAALVVTLHRLGAEHVAALGDSVRAIGRAGVGLDTIDVAAAKARGVEVVYQPYYATNEVADHAVTMMLAAQRRVCIADRLVREQGWASAEEVGPVAALRDLTVGIWGLGRIGRAVAARMVPFAGRIVAHDEQAVTAPDGVELLADAAALLSVADILTLHLPLTPETSGIVDRQAIDQLPAGALVVNVSRGALIDEPALAAALESGHLGGAALDVFATEPVPADSPLRSAPNVLLSPHLAWYSLQAGQRLATWILDDTVRFVDDLEPLHGAVA